jgi:hypothetical protein
MTEGEGATRRRQRKRQEKELEDYIKKCKEGKVVVIG